MQANEQVGLQATQDVVRPRLPKTAVRHRRRRAAAATHSPSEPLKRPTRASYHTSRPTSHLSGGQEPRQRDQSC